MEWELNSFCQDEQTILLLPQQMGWELNSHHHQDEQYDLLQTSGINEYIEAQNAAAFYTPAANQELFGIAGIQIQGGEAEDACQTCPNQPQQEAIEHPARITEVLSDHQNEIWPAGTTVNSLTRRRKGKILLNGTDSTEVCNSKGKAILGSMTQIQRKRKAELELNFRDDGSKKEAMNMVVDLPVWPSRKENSTIRCLNENGTILPNGTENDERYLKHKSTTKKEKKPRSEVHRDHRKKKKEAEIKLQNDYNILIESFQIFVEVNKKLEEENKKLLEDVRRLSNQNYHPKREAEIKLPNDYNIVMESYPIVLEVKKKLEKEIKTLKEENKKYKKLEEENKKLLEDVRRLSNQNYHPKRKAEYELNFDNGETKRKALNMVADHPQLHCQVYADPSMPGPSTTPKPRLPPNHCR